MKKLVIFLCCLIVLGQYAPALAEPRFRQIVIATGSPLELGLVTELGKAFEKEHTCTVRYIKTPTGPGLDLGRHGLAHITMGHNHKATAEFVQEGYAARMANLMHNHTIIIGPAKDPANIAGLTDLKAAHQRIFHTNSKYLSRGDGGGMHILEMKIWKELGSDPAGRTWYAVSNTFMLEGMLNSDRDSQYHMLDSSTWVMHKSKCHNSRMLVKGPPNEYEMCLVSADKNSNLKYNYGLAEKFFHFAISEKGQQIIAEFGIRTYGEALYIPDAIRSSK